MANYLATANGSSPRADGVASALIQNVADAAAAATRLDIMLGEVDGYSDAKFTFTALTGVAGQDALFEGAALGPSWSTRNRGGDKLKF